MWWPLIALSTSSIFALYVLIPVYIIFLMIMVEGMHKPGFATTTLISLLIGLQLFSDVRPFTYAVHHPLAIISYFIAYIALGFVYVWFKWASFVSMAVRRITALVTKDPNDPKEFSNAISAARCLGYKSIPFQVSDHKGKIITWMAYWPVSLTWTVLNDPLRRLFEYLYTVISHSLQMISNRAFAQIIDVNNTDTK